MNSEMDSPICFTHHKFPPPAPPVKPVYCGINVQLFTAENPPLTELFAVLPQMRLSGVRELYSFGTQIEEQQLMNMKAKTILISGASVAGPALAFWLHRYGFRTTIVERAPALRPGGYAVDFRGAGMEVLRRMQIVDEIRRFETRTGKVTMVDAQNKRVASMPDGFTSGELEIMRGDLANVLYEATKNSTEYIFNDTITGLTQGAQGVDVSFSRSPARRFDLVIGGGQTSFERKDLDLWRGGPVSS